MNATRILPELQSSLICESVRQEANGNFILVGVVNHVRVAQLPMTTGRFYVFSRWTAGVGRFHESVRLMAPDGITVVCQGGAEFELRDPSHHATNVSAFGHVEFKTVATYYLEMLVDEVMKLRAPLVVTLVPPSGQPSPAPVVENQHA